MACEYFQIPSSQGMLSMEAAATLTSSINLPLPGFSNPLSASAAIPTTDPWLQGNFRSLSLDDWAPPTKQRAPPSLFEPDDVEARAWDNIVPQQSADVLKASFEIKNPQKPKNFISTSSKIDAWTVIDPSVTVSTAKPVRKSPSQLSLSQMTPNPLAMSLTMSQQISMNQQQLSMSQGMDDDETALNRYKTELCKSFTETGVCRYGVKCQFAHGKEELRSVLRHPKYKTEICKTFHNTGTCPYGMRCRFIHTRVKEDHQVFSSSTSSFTNEAEVIEELDDDTDTSQVSPPPGIPVAQWSKSWLPSGSPLVVTKKHAKKAF